MSTHGYNEDAFPRKFGNYHLLAPLAQGGMGALYLAVKGDRGLERLLVIKTVLPHLADDEYIQRFRDEAKVVVKLSHANLIPVFDAGSVDGELFLAMDFVEGRDLRGVWNRCAKKQVAFPIDVAVYVVKELCRGLGYAHAFRGLELVHRDVSPPNVLVSYSGEVKVMDFGLANSTLKMEKTAPGIIYGKVAYMSPEQARGEKLDGRSDLYAAAIVLWELLTGRQLFPPGKDQPHDLLQRARNPMPTAPSQRAPRVPVALDEICMKGLAPDREDRYRNGEEFRKALAHWLADTHPSTDAARIETFLNDLFYEDIERERAEREALLSKIRHRTKTLPPSDELRQLFDTDQGLGLLGEGMRRASGSRGRRATDNGTAPSDRRRDGDRRKPRADSPGDSDPSMNGRTAKSAEPSPGDVIDNRYRVMELIGEGGMGKVYKGEHIELGRLVAIKILHPVYSRMPDLVERFRLEARAATKIGHPNIVDVTDSGKTSSGSTYFVMEFLDGEELGDLIGREGALDISRALRIVIQICRALAAAHQAGIIHRDLKPENIFLTVRDGMTDFVKVLDFGVATTIESGNVRTKRLTTPGTTMGTPEYMAPEQAAGHAADERCDVYALGSILYEVMTGTPPYRADNFMAILSLKATKDPEPSQVLRPELSNDIAELIKRAMAREPDERPASMDAFEMELDECLATREPLLDASLAGGRRARAGSEPSAVGLRPFGRAETNRPHNISEMEPTEAVTHIPPVADDIRSRWLPIVIIALAVVIVAIIFVLKTRGGKADEPAAAIDASTAAIDAAPNDDRARPVIDAGPVATPIDAAVVAIDAAAAADAPPQVAAMPDAEARKLLAEAARSARSLDFGKAKPKYLSVARQSDSARLKAKAHLGLANIAFQNGNADGVIRHAKRARRAGWEADLLAARGYKLKKNYGRALQYYQRVLKRKPSHAESLRQVEELKNK